MRPGEEREAARVLSLANIILPNSEALWGGKGEAERRMMEEAFRIVNLEDPRTYTVVARQGDRIIGALCTIRSPYCQVSFLDGLKLFPRMAKIMRGRFIQSLKTQYYGSKSDPKKTHWHLGPIGVLPEIQGSGAGTFMVEKVCELLDEKQEPGYLETDRLRVAQHQELLGFRIFKEVDILGVKNYCLWREPQIIKS
jgi:hypothetical protein